MKMERNLLNITDGVATFNADPFCICDYLDEVRNVIKSAGEILEHTPDNTDEWDWECMCAQLDLENAKYINRIYEVRDNGICVMILSNAEDYTI